MPDTLETLKRIALEAVEAGNPVQVAYGKVASVSPLQVQVGDKLLLPSQALIVPSALTTRQVDVTVSWTTDEGQGLATQHHHTVQSTATSTDGFDPAHTHTVSGRLTATLHCEFSVGESVLLLQMQGGQQYLILDKAGSV